MKKIIDTKSLLQTIINNPRKMFEVTLIINNSFQATHFIYTLDSNSLVDEGIDGEETNTLVIDFLTHYRAMFWKVDNML